MFKNANPQGEISAEDTGAVATSMIQRYASVVGFNAAKKEVVENAIATYFGE